MRGKLIVSYVEENKTKYETEAEFHFRLRDLQNYFVSPDDEIVAMIGGVERIFKYEEEFEKILRNELSGEK